MTTEDNDNGLAKAVVYWKEMLRKKRKNPKTSKRVLESMEYSIAVLEDIQRHSQGRKVH